MILINLEIESINDQKQTHYIIIILNKWVLRVKYGENKSTLNKKRSQIYMQNMCLKSLRTCFSGGHVKLHYIY